MPPREPATTESNMREEVMEGKKRRNNIEIKASVGPIQGPIGVAIAIYVITLVEKIENRMAQPITLIDIRLSRFKVVHDHDNFNTINIREKDSPLCA